MFNKIVIALLFVVLIFGYLNYSQNKESQQQLHDQITNLSQQAEKQQQREQERDELNKKLGEDALIAAHLSQGFHLVGMFKVAISEYYMTKFRLPESNEELYMDKPTNYAANAVKSVRVSKGGIITIVYDHQTGIDNGTINLTPEVSNTQINWHCTSKDYKNISSYFSFCKVAD
jgi:hypothetical protein